MKYQVMCWFLKPLKTITTTRVIPLNAPTVLTIKYLLNCNVAFTETKCPT